MLLLVSLLSITFLSATIESAGASEVSAEPSETDDWPMFHQNLANTGKSEATAPKSNQTL